MPHCALIPDLGIQIGRLDPLKVTILYAPASWAGANGTTEHCTVQPLQKCLAPDKEGNHMLSTVPSSKIFPEILKYVRRGRFLPDLSK